MTVDSELVSSIGKGLLVFAGIGKDDTEKDAENLVNKVLKAKFWPDENGVQVSHIAIMCETSNWHHHSGKRMLRILKGKYYVVCFFILLSTWNTAEQY